MFLPRPPLRVCAPRHHTVAVATGTASIALIAVRAAPFPPPPPPPFRRHDGAGAGLVPRGTSLQCLLPSGCSPTRTQPGAAVTVHSDSPSPQRAPWGTNRRGDVVVSSPLSTIVSVFVFFTARFVSEGLETFGHKKCPKVPTHTGISSGAGPGPPRAAVARAKLQSQENSGLHFVVHLPMFWRSRP